jgi:hypothetical protein
MWGQRSGLDSRRTRTRESPHVEKVHVARHVNLKRTESAKSINGVRPVDHEKRYNFRPFGTAPGRRQRWLHFHVVMRFC